MQRTGVQNKSHPPPVPPPPHQAGQPFNEWPLQLLAHHTCRLYSSCMCWNYKSLKSHFENTIKTFFSDCHNLPSHKNLRPRLQQQDVYGQLPNSLSRAKNRVGWEEMRHNKRREVSFSFFFSFQKKLRLR